MRALLMTALIVLMITDFQVTLISIVLMHILCNILRIFLGIMVVSMVEVQVSCIREYDQYIPSLWVMCLESVAHLLVMLNVSSNFLIYCSVSSPFKTALTKVFVIVAILLTSYSVLNLNISKTTATYDQSR